MQGNTRGRIARGAIIGRYQMFHKGHLDTIKHIDSQPDIDEIVIGIGSSQYDRNNKNWEMPWITNPFTYEERKEMVTCAINGQVKKPVRILPVQDLHNCEKWIEYVIHTLPEFNVFFTNTEREIKYFEKKGYELRGIPIGGSFHAQTIREMIALDEDWQKYVPEGVSQFIKKVNGKEILRELFQEHSDEIITAHNFFPDYEWRTFDKLSANDLENVLDIPLASTEGYTDEYLLHPDRNDINIKLRSDVLKIKKEIETHDGLEQSATYPYRFPIKTRAVDQLLREVKLPTISDSSIIKSKRDNDYVTEPEFRKFALQELNFLPVSVVKNREVRFYNSCAIDYQKIMLHDEKRYESIALESRSRKKILTSLEELGLNKYRSWNYARFLSGLIFQKYNQGK